MAGRKNIRIGLVVLVFLAGFAGTTFAGRIIYVDDDANGANNGTRWADAYNYLQDALADANSADKPVEIKMAEGVYRPGQGGGNMPGDREATFRLINDVTIRGGYAGSGEPHHDERDVHKYQTTLSGDLNGDDEGFANNEENSLHVVTGSGTDETAVLDGFTITSGNANRSYPYDCGGGMFNDWYSSPTVTNCIFSGNRADYGGGGMYNLESNPMLTNCTFSGNSASDSGGGMLNDWYSSPTVTNCIFSGNRADYGGGGMFNWHSSPTVTNCTFSGNSARYGGGMFNMHLSSPTVTNCTFSGNSASDSGGGMRNGSSSPKITNCTFSGNTAGYWGGGMANWASSPTLTNCTFSGNTALEYGGGVYSEQQSNPEITNCIIWDNSAEMGAELAVVWRDDEPSTVSTSYCNIKGGREAAYVDSGCILNWGEGMIDAEPGFAFDSDYHLVGGSACIDAGTNSPAGGLAEVDMDGNIRCLDGDGDSNEIADMGVYEFNLQQPSIAVSTESVGFFMPEGATEPNEQILSIRNCGGGGLQWKISEGCRWLEVMPAVGVSCGEVNEVVVKVDPSRLKEGDYRCKVFVEGKYAVNSPRTIVVMLHGRNILHVPEEYGTIQAAIDAAMDGDVVVIAPGIYIGAGNRDIDFKGKAITVRSIDPNDANIVAGTIIDCGARREDRAGRPPIQPFEGYHRGFHFHSGEDCNSVIDGLTIQNGYIRELSGGGGILVEGSSPTIRNCIIKDNKAGYREWPWGQQDAFGGGISCLNGSNARIIDCTIVSNEAFGSGGGIACVESSVMIRNCVISNNEVWGLVSPWFRYAGLGGGICCLDGGDTQIIDCTIVSNKSNRGGGGIACYKSSPTISNCVIGENSSVFGGGIDCDDNSNPVITDCIITDNQIGGGGIGDMGFGGGVCCGGNSNPSIVNCQISGNQAGYYPKSDRGVFQRIIVFPPMPSSGSGGGIGCTGSSPTILGCAITGNCALYSYFGGGGICCLLNSNASIVNCTVADNYSSSCGGGISCGESDPTVTNSILWGNTARIILWDDDVISLGPQIGLTTFQALRPSTLTVSYCDIQGGEAAAYIDYGCELNWLGGNIDADPCFVRPGCWVDVNDPNIIVEPNDVNAVWVDGDYHLPAGSPCINEGDPDYVAGPNETDIDGQPRVWDGRVDMGADEFVPMLEVAMRFTPQALKVGSKGKWVKAHFVLPEGFGIEDVDANTPAVIEPLGIESEYMNIFVNEDGLVEIEAAFGRSDFCSMATGDKVIEVKVIGRLTSGQYFYGTDTIRVINNGFQYLAALASHWLEEDCTGPDWCGGLDLNQDSIVNLADFAMLDGCCIEIITE